MKLEGKIPQDPDTLEMLGEITKLALQKCQAKGSDVTRIVVHDGGHETLKWTIYLSDGRELEIQELGKANGGEDILPTNVF